ncbi:carboxypeptidase-like regulatory domain-containing protein [Mucilaginibacter sabulilitoris]|uniref:Carboxypeptidase-like regulatory domain-containing protein n=1 Tax=Mucilaginibacter sabulilitoris TaxID=1173583 RepID=A0ABZ0TRY0_9SPHI|nr:carboxypeptidase-like regulatory domain-containing protein [Mucilaginibacter sabulilitoris]WPU95867.1 carboxypeptidase-like regulatory domain-containing protein [Mucilaginibacter sabulilitoris]
MRKLILYLAFAFLVKVSFAQSIETTGTVKNEHGQPISLAFVSDQKTQNATYTDSLGTFKLNTAPASTLEITCAGYKSTITKVDNAKDINVVLTAGESANTSKTLSFDNANNPLFESHTQMIDVLAMISPKSSSGEVRGSRYLFNDWMHGYVVDNKGVIVQDKHYLFNYDKIEGGLLMTSNKSTAIEVNRDQIKTFTLFDNKHIPLVFENVPAINKNHYVEVITAGKNVNIYKDLGTMYEKANFSTNGMMSTGHNYDAYIDKSNYYVVMKQGAPQKLSLKKKTLKTIFSSQSDKVDKFIADNSSSDIDDNYLKALGDYLNN